MQIPTYEHVIIATSVLDRNGEFAVKTEDERYKGAELDSLLWFEYFSPSSLVDHAIKSCYLFEERRMFLWAKALGVHMARPFGVL